MTEYDSTPQRQPEGPADRPVDRSAQPSRDPAAPAAEATPQSAPSSAAQPAQHSAPPSQPGASPAQQHPGSHQADTTQTFWPQAPQAPGPTQGGAAAGQGAQSAPPAPHQAHQPHQQAYQGGGLPPWAAPTAGTAAQHPHGPYPGQPGAPGHGGGYGQPAWGPPGPAGHRPSRFGRIVATGAAAVVLAVGSGLFGGFIATRFDNDPAAGPVRGDRTAAAAPALERGSLASIADAVQPSVVSIATGSSEGSGVVLTEDGYVLTNNHVVASAQGAQVNVVFADGKTAQAKIVGTDARTDLAVIKADGISDLSPATFGDSGAMQVGDTVLALGSPLGLQGSVTAGIVSALDRTIQVGGEQQSPLTPPTGVSSMAGLLQTDAPINPGNSGGALVNLNGEVIGINTAIATSGQGQGNIGVGFAIPSNKAKQVAEQLKTGEKVSHPFLGVNVTDAEGGNGALVGTVQPNSPAAAAGLQKGDIVTRLGDKEVKDADDLVSAVQSGKAGDRMEVTYVRNGAQATATVTLGEAS